MSMTFEALTGVLALDSQDWSGGFDSAGRKLQQFNAETAATFNDIAAKSNRSLSEVVVSANNLAETLGTDVSSAALLLSESLESPIAGLDLLTKAGMEFTDAERAQIQQLAEAGQGFEAQAGILDLVREKYDSAAVAADALAQSAAEAAQAQVPEVSASPAGDSGGSGLPFGLSANMLKGGAMLAAAKEAIDAYHGAELAAASYAAQQEATGNASGFSLARLQELGAELQEVAAIEDDMVVATGASLLKFKNITGDTFEATIRSAADMSAALGMDLPSAAEMLGRALEDPVNGLDRLRRAGIFFSDESKAQIAAFMEVNDVASAQKLILESVAEKFDGVAAKIGGTSAKQWEKMLLAIGDAFEAIGREISELEKHTGILTGLKWIVEQLANAFSLVGGGISAVVALIKGDFGQLEVIANRLMAKLLDVRASLNKLVGDDEEAASLKATADSYRNIADSIEHTRKKQEELNKARRDGVTIPQPSVGGAPSAPGASRSTGSVASSTASPSGSPAATGPEAKMLRLKAYEDAQRFSYDAEGVADIKSGGTDAGRKFVDQMTSEIEKYGNSQELQFDFKTMKLTGESERDIQNILGRYRELAKHIDGYDASTWQAIENRAGESLRKAAKSTGDQRELYLSQARDTLAGARKMYDEADRVAAEAKKKIDDAAAATKKAADDAAKKAEAAKQGRGDVAGPQGSARRPAQEAAGVDPYVAMKTASKNQLQSQLGTRMQQSQALISNNALLSPEDRKGLAILQREWAAAMKKVRDSTGEARAANIEELKKIDEAWARAYKSIREGSSKTAEQLVSDAKKQGKSGVEAAKEKGLSNKEKRQNEIAARAADDQLMRSAKPMDAIFAMSRELSGIFNGAMGSVGQGSAMLAQIMNETTDPMAKLALESDNLNARLSMATLNAQTFGGSLQLVTDLQKELSGLQQKEMEIRRKQDEDRKAAEDRRNENYKKRELEKDLKATEQRRELGYDIASSITVGAKAGAAPIINLYGIHDDKEMVARIDRVLKTRGTNRGVARTLETK